MVTDQFLNALPVWGGILKIGQEAKGGQVVLLPANSSRHGHMTRTQPIRFFH